MMKAFDIYSIFTGSMSDFAKNYKDNDNEVMYNQARAFWKTLEGSAWLLILVFLVLGIAFAYYYYKPFNNSPGRHYKPKYWWIFMLVTIISTFLLTLGMETFIASPKLDGAFMIELKIAAANMLYVAVIYFFTSLVWCNWGSTNAYRYLKF